MNTAVEVPAVPESGKFMETLAHELRQPLSAIESTAYYLSMVLPRGEKRAQEHALRMQRLIEQANWILSCAVQLADTSPLAPQPLDLEEFITQTVAAQPSEAEGLVRLDLSGNLPLVDLDPGRARSLIGNLLAMTRRAADGAQSLRIRTATRPGEPREVSLELQVEAPEHVCSERSEECLGAGAALGIESARRIVDAHGGSFRIDFEAPGGVRVDVLFPKSSCSSPSLERVASSTW